jgi:hypothetical protein
MTMMNPRSVNKSSTRALFVVLGLAFLAPVAFDATNDKRIALQIIRFGYGYAAHGPFCAAIRSQQEWNRLSDLQSANSDKPPTGVDFSKSILLVASGGYQPNRASVTFDSAIEGDNAIRVHATLMLPGNCPRMPEIGYPSTLALIAQTKKPIYCEIQTSERNCTGR